MQNPFVLVSELWYSDESTHVFQPIRQVRKPLKLKTLGVYRRCLDTANQKIRYASYHFIELMKILRELEHGEFIYFDDGNWLRVHAALEAHLVFLRASLDVITRAWWAYFTDTTKLDSFHDLLKKLTKTPTLIPPSLSEKSREHWRRILADYVSVEFSWLNALVGTESRQSLRDIAVHRSVLNIDTTISDEDRGFFVLQLGSDIEGDAVTWLDRIFGEAQDIVDCMAFDIEEAEKALSEHQGSDKVPPTDEGESAS